MKDVSHSRVQAWFELVRLPAVFTAVSDVLAGYLVADGGWERPLVCTGLLLATISFYWAGMVLNDVFDIEIDRKERPRRPLPSGRISIASARRAGFGLLVAGLVFIAAIVYPLTRNGTTGLWAIGLVVCIVLYNRTLKHTLAGPIAMGLCRALNMLMAISVSERAGLWESYTPWLIAGGIGLYVAGVAWFARSEVELQSPRHFLFGGLMMMVLGVAFIVVFPIADQGVVRRVVFTNDWIWPLMVCLLTAPVWRHGVTALLNPAPARVQTAVGQALMTLISLDALIVLIVAGPVAALIILALAIPAALLRQRFAVT